MGWRELKNCVYAIAKQPEGATLIRVVGGEKMPPSDKIRFKSDDPSQFSSRLLTVLQLQQVQIIDDQSIQHMLDFIRYRLVYAILGA